jgi:hypothetical protein
MPEKVRLDMLAEYPMEADTLPEISCSMWWLVVAYKEPSTGEYHCATLPMTLGLGMWPYHKWESKSRGLGYHRCWFRRRRCYRGYLP